MKLTLPQQDIYFEQLLYPDDPIYNIGAMIRIKGHIDFELLKKAHKVLIKQHDAYRCVFKGQEDELEPSFQIVNEFDNRLGFVDFSMHINANEVAHDYMQTEFSKPFNLEGKNLLHFFTLIKLNEDLYYLFSVYHHIITDGWGTSLMFQRLVQNYNELFEYGKVIHNYSFTYTDFVKDDIEYQNSSTFKEDSIYWEEKFKILPDRLFDKKNLNEKLNRSSRTELVIKKEMCDQLRYIATEQNVSLFHLILTVLFSYFGRKYENNDIVIGVPVLNRNKSSYKNTVGLFMGVTPLRIQLNFEETMRDLMHSIKAQVRKDYRHQRFPLRKLISNLQLLNDLDHLFDIMVSYEKHDYTGQFVNTVTKVIPLSHQAERLALAIYIREFSENEDIKIDFDYNLNYFDEFSANQLVSHIENIFFDVVENSDKKISELIYLSRKEVFDLSIKFNDTEVNYPTNRTIIDLFSEQVKIYPKKIAIKDDNKSYSYCELDEKSNQIAVYLKKNVISKFPIIVLLPRSIDLVMLLLAILKSGIPYIPIDPRFPKERIKYISQNSQSKFLIREKKRFDENFGNGIVVLDIEEVLSQQSDCVEIEWNVDASDTAYIMYTSGSTGRPKGVEISHQALYNFSMSIQQKLSINPDDLLFSVTTHSFDISFLEFFIPILSGASVYVASQAILLEPYMLSKKIENIDPSVIQGTPSFYQMLYNAGWKGSSRLKVLCGGDILNSKLADKLICTNLEVWNMYGPTETTIWSCIKKMKKFTDALIIGSPIDNTQIYILDSFLTLKPIGIPGKIYIAGKGLAKGYYKNSILTKEKFIINPFNIDTLLYDTGDFGYWNQNGEIVFLGRKDSQIKLRGYRIELREIEFQLNNIDGVKDSAVIMRKGEEHDAYLIAYLLLDDVKLDIYTIQNSLTECLPSFMIPSKIIILEEFPLTPNQKLDRKELERLSLVQEVESYTFKAPSSELEVNLEKYWKEVLYYKEKISCDANFFALGGHSLNAVKLIRLINENLCIKIPMRTIFDYPTIESLANYLKKCPLNNELVIIKSLPKLYYRLTPVQYTIWVASQVKDVSIAYNICATYTINNIIDSNRITKSINKIIEKFEILRTSIVEVEGWPVQKINSFNDILFSIPKIKVEKKNVGLEIKKIINSEFNFESDSLIRVVLLEICNTNSILVFCTHHLIMDGISIEIFIKEFIKNYNEEENKKIIDVNELNFQFKDYSEWINDRITDKKEENSLFWKKYLEKYKFKNTFAPTFLNQENKKRGKSFYFEFTQEDFLALKAIAAKEKVTFFTVLLTSWNILIHLFSRYHDICIGMVHSGRDAAGLDNQLGMFSKTLILRTKIEKELVFLELLKETQLNLLEISMYQDFPLTMQLTQFFDCMIVYQNSDFQFDSITKLNDIQLKYNLTTNEYNRIPLTLNLIESKSQLRGVIDYNCDIYSNYIIEKIVREYLKVLKRIINNPLLTIASINSDFDFEEENSLMDFNFNF
jgi:amino acid adenylation domain-containing protein